MLIIGIILLGMLAGAGAQLVLGRSRDGIDWTTAIVAGLVGSFVGGLGVNLLTGQGLELEASGLVGSLAGAIVVTAAWGWWRGRRTSTATDRASRRSGDPRKADPR